MDKQVIIEYIEQNGGVEIPALQKQFNLTFKQARDIVAEQVAANNLRYEQGLWFAATRRVEYQHRVQVRLGLEPNSTQTLNARSRRMDKFLHELRDQRLERIRKKLAQFSPVSTEWDEKELKSAVNKEIDELMLKHKFDALETLRDHAFSEYENSLFGVDTKQTELYERLIYELGQLTPEDFNAIKRRLFGD